MKTEKGLTLVELMVVLSIIGLLMVFILPRGLSWIAEQRFSSGTRAFLNAGQLVRLQALQGQVAVPITTMEPGATGGGGATDKQFRLTTGPYTMTFNKTPTSSDVPIVAGDYVTLMGFNTPDHFNGNIFEVMSVTKPSTAPAHVTENQYTVASFTFVVKCCAEEDSNKCLAWNDTATTVSTTTGRAIVAAALRFIPDSTVRGPYSVVKRGNSYECRYQPAFLRVRVSLVSYSADGSTRTEFPVYGGSKPADTAGSIPIVFDWGGSTRNRAIYRVHLQRVIRDPDREPWVIFTFLPSGKVRVGG
ncbi:Tfp pilus assembly protein FimT/FimU [Thermodesulfobacteriota bacterium]